MEPTLDQKLIRLAFDPAAQEGEAINAFLMYRKKYAKIPMASELPKPPREPAAFEFKAPKKKVTSIWNIVLHAKKFDAFISILSTWKKTPFYAINVTTERKVLSDAWKFQIVCEFEDADEQWRFEKYFDSAVDRIIRS